MRWPGRRAKKYQDGGGVFTGTIYLDNGCVIPHEVVIKPGEIIVNVTLTEGKSTEELAKTISEALLTQKRRLGPGS